MLGIVFGRLWYMFELLFYLLLIEDKAPVMKWRADGLFVVLAACIERGANLVNRHHPGVWAPRIGKYSCCGQESRDAPGCKDETSHVLTAPLIEIDKKPLRPRMSLPQSPILFSLQT